MAWLRSRISWSGFRSKAIWNNLRHIGVTGPFIPVTLLPLLGKRGRDLIPVWHAEPDKAEFPPQVEAKT